MNRYPATRPSTSGSVRHTRSHIINHQRPSVNCHSTPPQSRFHYCHGCSQSAKCQKYGTGGQLQYTYQAGKKAEAATQKTRLQQYSIHQKREIIKKGQKQCGACSLSLLFFTAQVVFSSPLCNNLKLLLTRTTYIRTVWVSQRSYEKLFHINPKVLAK